MSKELMFFATPSDLHNLLLPIQSKLNIVFTPAGLFEWPDVQTIEDPLGISSLGVAHHHDKNQLPYYLVHIPAVVIEARIVPQRRGGLRYAIDQIKNRDTIAFQPGGLYGDDAVIAGDVSTVSSSSASTELFREFQHEFKRSFRKVKTIYVGKEAFSLLKNGARLTVNLRYSATYDLPIPA